MTTSEKRRKSKHVTSSITSSYITESYMHLKDLKKKSPSELVTLAEELGVENASSLRTQDLTFSIIKQMAKNDVVMMDEGVIEVLQDGFGFLRSPESNYLAGPDDIYVSPGQIKRFGMRTGDTIEG